MKKSFLTYFWNKLLNYWRIKVGPIIYLTVGISGSGKSKFADFFLKGVQATEINLDNIRKELGNVSDQSQNDKVFKIADNRMIAELAGGFNVFLSNTNLRIGSIKELTRRFPHNDIVVFVMEDAFDKQLCADRVADDIENGLDRSNVPAEVIDSQFERFTNMVKELKAYHNPQVTVRYVSRDFKIK